MFRALVIINFTPGLYLQYTLLYDWEKALLGLTANTTVGGMELENPSSHLDDRTSITIFRYTHKIALKASGTILGAGARGHSR